MGGDGFGGCRRQNAHKTVDPKANGFTAHDDAMLCQQILDIRRAERIAVVRTDCKGDSRAGNDSPSDPAWVLVFSYFTS